MKTLVLTNNIINMEAVQNIKAHNGRRTNGAQYQLQIYYRNHDQYTEFDFKWNSKGARDQAFDMIKEFLASDKNFLEIKNDDLDYSDGKCRDVDEDEEEYDD